MKKIILIIPYFGKLPEFFKVWLISAAHNPTVDFCIPCNAKWSGELPQNVKLIPIEWEAICRRVKNVCGEDIVLNEPYKLCDYRPAYGEIFKDDIQGYDFWGHCDCDLVFGDIRKFLTDEILDRYDRILTRGHFCLYSNTKDVNALYKKTTQYKGISFWDAFHTKYSCHFDEGHSINAVFREFGRGTYDEICFADISYRHYPFQLAQDIHAKDAKQIYSWENGTLKCFYLNDEKNICENEYMYVHLQKRKMQISTDKLEQEFHIVPNSICLAEQITKEYIEENSRDSWRYQFSYHKMRISSILKNIKNGALVFRLNGKSKA